ncbi:hypothetical protein BBJ28_00018902 [Nothophytophthora sp. Chile5]|nr:hypothetical protein BBJ28_00018902 [Nothophytophthora sp. Chile5]
MWGPRCGLQTLNFRISGGDLLAVKAVDACGALTQRAEEVDAFRESLRPGPLREIVYKQVVRLQEAARQLESPTNRLTVDLLGIQVDKPRSRAVPIRVTPFMGSALARAAAKVGRKPQTAKNSRSAVAKPLYKWEKRRFSRSSTVRQPNVAASKTSNGRKTTFADECGRSLLKGMSASLCNRQLTSALSAVPMDLDSRIDLEDVDEAGMELRVCSEPGHYTRSSSTKALPGSIMAEASACFEFQVVLTEEEFKSLKVRGSVYCLGAKSRR